MELGYWLSSEEFGPRDLVAHAELAERAGLPFALVSDHYHPWVDAQGQSPFVWSTIGGIAATTERIRIGTAVTCPLIRTHPAVVAQAAATSSVLLEGRFFLGVGTGENLNEHVLGDKWPQPSVRLEMLEEAVEILRALWQGGYQSHRGTHYTVERARLYTLPDEPPPIVVAAAAEEAAKLAGRIGDGYMNTAPDEELVRAYEGAGGKGPRYGKLLCCFLEDEKAARRRLREQWPSTALGGTLGQDLATPSDFEAAVEHVPEDAVAEKAVLGRDPDVYRERIEEWERAGFTHVALHHVGPEQAAFVEFVGGTLLSD
jgi:coenzyme F420-dependent glucose-6-phosphate dehydrogenase